MKINILTAAAAKELVTSTEFLSEWGELHAKCPWSAVYQSHAFIIPWYQAYEPWYSPVLIIGRNSDNQLKGLLALAIDKRANKLVFAGTNNAVYHAWLSDPADGDQYIEFAFEKLAQKYQDQILHFEFTPPSLPMNVFNLSTRWKSVITPYQRGLVTLGDGQIFRDNLKKKKQGKLNKLNKFGELSCTRVESQEEFSDVFDKLMLYKTLRFRAMNDNCDFIDDIYKREFYLKLFEKEKMLYVSTLKIGDHVASVQLHLYNGERVIGTLIGYSPYYSKWSPGMLHLLMCFADLGETGTVLYDLTPGVTHNVKDNYKDLYATEYSTAHTVDLYFDSKKYALYKIKHLAAQSGKLGATSLGLDYSKLKQKIGTLGKQIDILKSNGSSNNRNTIHPELNSHHTLPDCAECNRDNLNDLFFYMPQSAKCLRVNDFYRVAWDNYVNGLHSYSLVKDGVLLHCRWINEETSETVYSYSRKGNGQ